MDVYSAVNFHNVRRVTMERYEREATNWLEFTLYDAKDEVAGTVTVFCDAELPKFEDISELPAVAPRASDDMLAPVPYDDDVVPHTDADFMRDTEGE